MRDGEVRHSGRCARVVILVAALAVAAISAAPAALGDVGADPGGQAVSGSSSAPAGASPVLLMLLVVASVAAGVVPTVSLLALIWWLDRYDREPLWMLAGAFLWGAVGASTLSCCGNTVFNIGLSAVIGPNPAAQVSTVLWAPGLEELTKGLVVVAVYFHRKFDNLTDGVVYGAASGLGFAMTENSLYYLSALDFRQAIDGAVVASWVRLIIMRTAFTALMHMVASAVFGAALGSVKFRDISVWAKLAVGLLGMAAACSVHAIWNGLLVTADLLDDAQPFLASIGIFALEFLMVVSVFQLSLLFESRTIRLELKREAELGTLPHEHVEPLSRFLLRCSRRFDPQLRGAKAHYLALATELAFRRHQLATCSPGEREWLESELVDLRARLREMLVTETPGSSS